MYSQANNWFSQFSAESWQQPFDVLDHVARQGPSDLELYYQYYKHNTIVQDYFVSCSPNLSDNLHKGTHTHIHCVLKKVPP